MNTEIKPYEFWIIAGTIVMTLVLSIINQLTRLDYSRPVFYFYGLGLRFSINHTIMSGKTTPVLSWYAVIGILISLLGIMYLVYLYGKYYGKNKM